MNRRAQCLMQRSRIFGLNDIRSGKALCCIKIERPERFDHSRLVILTLAAMQFQDLTVTDDTVLEDHNEDPSLVQMRLIGDGGELTNNLQDESLR